MTSISLNNLAVVLGLDDDDLLIHGVFQVCRADGSVANEVRVFQTLNGILRPGQIAIAPSRAEAVTDCVSKDLYRTLNDVIMEAADKLPKPGLYQEPRIC